jgi:hypothetical protein
MNKAAQTWSSGNPPNWTVLDDKGRVIGVYCVKTAEIAMAQHMYAASARLYDPSNPEERAVADRIRWHYGRGD